MEEGERVDLSPATLRTDRAQIEQTIRSALGKILLIRLTPKYLDDLYSAMKAGRSPKTIRNHHAIVSAALQQAVRWGWMRENPARRAKYAVAPGIAPQREGPPTGLAPVEDRLVFTVEEAAKLLGISRAFAYEPVKRGDIPSMRIGRRILVPKAALERFLAEAPHKSQNNGHT